MSSDRFETIDQRVTRRQFGRGLLAGGAAAALPGTAFAARPPYRGPNVIIIRFGGGVRRRETIEPATSYSPYMLKTLAKRGTLFRNMVMGDHEDVITGHGHGTLYLLTGRYDRYKDPDSNAFNEQYEPKAPTIFEYFRRAYRVPPHETLIVNSEDRAQEEFFTFSNDLHYGVRYKSEMLSLRRFKVWLHSEALKAGTLTGEEKAHAEKAIAKFVARDSRLGGKAHQDPVIAKFWQRWMRDYGTTGTKNPRGDRLLTALARRALDELKPRLMLVNYNDPDYVHWGNPSHYTRGIAVIDDGIRQLVEAADARDGYRGNTVFVIAPDCGRDDNRLMPLPYQHHFNSKSAHEVFALFFGPGIAKGRVITQEVQQTGVAATVGKIMRMPTPGARGPVLAQAFA